MIQRAQFLVLAILSLSLSCYSQGWEKLIGGPNGQYAYDVIQTPDGGYLVCGKSFDFSAGSSDIYLVKTDATGTVQWSKTYGTSGIEEAHSVVTTADGGYMVTATSNGYATLMKVDATGGFMWAKYSSALSSSGNSGVPLASNYGVAGLSPSGIGLSKFSSSGDVLSQQEIEFSALSPTYVRGTTTSFGGGIVITGFTGPSFQTDIFIVESIFSSNCSFAHILESPDNEYVQAIQRTSDIGFVLAGSTESYGAGGLDAYLVKLDGGGNVMWAKTIGGTGDDEARSVIQTNDGGYMVAAHIADFGSTLIKTDAAGNVQWSSSYRSEYCSFNKVIATNDGGYLAVGTATEVGGTYGRFFMVKVDANGNSGCVQTVPPFTVGTATPGLEDTPSTLVTPYSPFNYTRSMQLNAGGTVSDLCIVHAEEQITERTFAIYPNPSSEELFIRLPENSPSVTVRIYDLMGKEVMPSRYCDQNSNRISIADLVAGHYFVSITSVDGNEDFMFQKQ